MSPKRKGKKREKYGRKKFYHERRRNKKYRKALKSWKQDYPDFFEFDADRYPFYFPLKNPFFFENLEKKLKEVKKLGKGKRIKIIKLTASGHTEVTLARSAAYDIICESLDQGLFVFCEPDKIVVSKRSELQGCKVEKAVIYAPVAGG